MHARAFSPSLYLSREANDVALNYMRVRERAREHREVVERDRKREERGGGGL